MNLHFCKFHIYSEFNIKLFVRAPQGVQHDRQNKGMGPEKASLAVYITELRLQNYARKLAHFWAQQQKAG
jgi:hypothetical protein